MRVEEGRGKEGKENERNDRRGDAKMRNRSQPLLSG